MAEHQDDDDWTGVPDDVDELLQRMRAASLPIEHSLYASIHDTAEEMDEIAGRLHEADVQRWRRQYRDYLRRKKGQDG